VTVAMNLTKIMRVNVLYAVVNQKTNKGVEKMSPDNCEYCNENNNADNLRGNDGVFYNNEDGRYYLYIEHFRNEIYMISVNYCPKCGLELSK
jgi:hypothetical protein